MISRKDAIHALEAKGIKVYANSKGFWVKKSDLQKVVEAAAVVDFNAPAKVKATTLSVLMPEKKGMVTSVTVGVYVQNKGGNKEYTNLTLRFDQGKAATLRGYPNEWAVYDENTHNYDTSSMTYEEYLDADSDLFHESMDESHLVVYVSKETEKEIFNQLKKSIEKQFKKKDWKDTLPEDSKKKVLEMMDVAINSLG